MLGYKVGSAGPGYSPASFKVSSVCFSLKNLAAGTTACAEAELCIQSAKPLLS